MIMLGIYLHAAFGSFRPSYSYYDLDSPFGFMQTRGYFGLTYPHLDVVMKLLFGCQRGIFFAAPVALAAPIGLRWLWKEKTTRSAAMTATAIAVYYLLFNASFLAWTGGVSYGPRYAGAAIPLFCLGLAPAWSRVTARWRMVLAGLAVCSLFFALMVVSTNSQLTADEPCPMRHSISAFLKGKMAIEIGSIPTPGSYPPAGWTGHGAFNLGQRLGLHGLPTVIPLFAAWGIAAKLWIRLNRGIEMAA
jgi:hypothetical protein